MQLRHRAALNGVELDEIDSRVIIQGIECGGPKSTQSAISLFGANGQRFAVNQRDNMDVKVKFGLLIRKTDMAARAALLDQVNNWAALAQKEYGGAWLTVNYKDNRRLHVYLVEPAEEGDLKEWTNVFDLTFRAYGVPYWQDELGTILRILDADSVNRQFGVPGNMNSTLDVEFKNTSGARIDTFTIRTGISVITLADLGLKNKETLVITHDDTGKRNLLRIYIINTDGEIRSAMDKRTTASSDDLITEPGTIRVRMSAGGTGTLLITGAGRYA